MAGSLQEILRREPKMLARKHSIDEARNAGRDAAERLVTAGREGDIVILMLGKNGKIHVKDYGRTG